MLIASWWSEWTMPYRLATPCRYPGCPKLSQERFCVVHARQTQRAYDAARGTTQQRGYGWKWQALRKEILQRDPYCRWPGCRDRSVHVDHVVSKRRGGTDAPMNLQGLCTTHHSEKTCRYDGGFGAA